MARYLELTAALAARIAVGELAPGAPLPSTRTLADEEATTPATVTRAYRALADSGAVVLEPRRTAVVAPQGALAAQALLRVGAPFRLAGSDDPALRLLADVPGAAVVPVGPRGSYGGLTALWAGDADGATLHLRHRDGEYNAPFARALLAGRRPVLVHLWRREQGLVVPAGNPRGLRSVGDLRRLRVARRPHGTGTRALLDRLVLDAGLDPDALAGPEVELHLDVALAVATGEADAGLAVRSAAGALGLDLVPVGWEPFQVATTEAAVGGVRPLVTALGDPATAERVRGLGGYDLAGAGEILALG
jgi:molybdate-binding protein